MDFQRGYRLKLASAADLAKLLAGFRGSALRLLAADYGARIARVAVGTLDEVRIGLATHERDLLVEATRIVKAAHEREVDGVFAPQLNCVIEFFFVGGATLAVMETGADRYRRAWEARREVVPWGSPAKNGASSRLTDRGRKERDRAWEAARRQFGSGIGRFRFQLLSDGLPTPGWATIGKHMPSFESRVAQSVAKLAAADGADPASLAPSSRADYGRRVAPLLPISPNRDSFRPGRRKAEGDPPRDEGKGRGRGKQPGRPSVISVNRGPGRTDGAAGTIDHADIVVASDGRAFMAVPFVNLRKEDRVFIQVGSKDVTFQQNSIHYGTVTDVSAGARDYLRGLTSITLVEVGEVGGRRLLRAKHAAMVSDISPGEGLRRPIETFRRRGRDVGMQQEIEQ